jgi:hypothetical protein
MLVSTLKVRGSIFTTSSFRGVSLISLFPSLFSGYPNSSASSSSPITLTPSFSALSRFEPPPSPESR